MNPTHPLALKVAGIMVILGSLFLVWSIYIDGHWVRVPLVITAPVTTEYPTYRPGETVYINISYCKKRALDAVLQCTLVNDYMTFYSPRHASREVGCGQVRVPIQPLPETAHQGVYHFECAVSYRINGFNTVVVPYRTNDFEVQ